MIVLDSSVILQWIFDGEEGHERAIAYRHRHITEQDLVAIPSLFFYEAANVLATKSGLSSSDASDVFMTFWDFDFEVYDPARENFLNSIVLSKKYGISLYDAAYVESAITLKCNFVTADKSLYDRLKHMKGIRLL